MAPLSTSTSFERGERALARLVERHTNPLKGMSNVMVGALCRPASEALAEEAKKSLIFAGVFCADTIPFSLASGAARESCFVVNLAKNPRSTRTGRRRRRHRQDLPAWPLSAKETQLLSDLRKREGVGWKDVASAVAKSSLPPDSGHFVFIHLKPRLVFYADSFGLPCYQEDVRTFLAAACEKRDADLTFTERTLQDPLSMACGLYAALRVLTAQAGRDFGRYEWKMRRLKDNDDLCIQYIRSLLN